MPITKATTSCNHITGVNDISVSVVTQQEVLIGHRFTAFALLYQASGRDHELHKCRNFRPSFYEALTERVGQLRTVSGQPYRMVSMDDAIGATDKARAFSLFLTEPMRRLDESLVANALQEAWVTAFTGSLQKMKNGCFKLYLWICQGKFEIKP